MIYKKALRCTIPLPFYSGGLANSELAHRYRGERRGHFQQDAESLSTVVHG